MNRVNLNIEKKYLFPIPLYKSNLNYPYIDNLKKLLYQIKAKDQGRKISNIGGWQSHDNLLDYPELKFINNFLDIFTKKELKVEKYTLNNAWGNISSQYCYNEIHDHSCQEDNTERNKITCWSGVFYIQCNKDSGGIKFHKPNQPSTYTAFIPSNNDLIIFPASLPHSVLSNVTEQDRISIAFNFLINS